MAIRHKNVSVRSDQDICRPNEVLWTATHYALRAQRQENLPIRTEFGYLVALALGSSSVGHPQVVVLVDLEAMGKRKQTLTDAFDEPPRRIELKDWRLVCVDACAYAASVKNKDVAMAIDCGCI